MHFRIRHDRPSHDRSAAGTRHSSTAAAHVITSDFATGLCRFTLSCTCGAQWDTPYIDEALEWRELHQRLAPLADQLVP